MFSETVNKNTNNGEDREVDRNAQTTQSVVPIL